MNLDSPFNNFLINPSKAQYLVLSLKNRSSILCLNPSSGYQFYHNLITTTTMSKQGHQPERFEVFNELKDRSGFTIAGCQHVFKYDRHGGWYDEHSNYYDKNGNPEDAPSDDDYSEHEKSDHSDNEDEFEREFGRPKDYFEQDEDLTNVAQLQRIATNLDSLKQYPSNKPLRVNFNNLGYFSKKEEVFNWYQGKVAGITNLIFFNNQKGFNGKGYFIVNSIKAAEDLVKLEGEKYADREVSFEVDNVEDFLLTPLEPNELAEFKSVKKYVNKNEGAKKQTTTVTKPAQNVVKPKAAYVKIEENEARSEVKPQVKPKVEQKKEQRKIVQRAEKKEEKINPEEFATFTFKKSAFPKKSSFKEWLTEHKYTEADYKAVEKIPGNQQFAKITMKNKIYLHLNNGFYNGEKIVFTPV